MKSVMNEFPNPVLSVGRDDYIESCIFGTVFEEDNITVTTDDIVIPIKYLLVCDGLQQFIEHGKAIPVIKVKSSASSYSRLFPFSPNETDMELHIPKFSVVKRIEISGSIVASEAINNFKCEGEFNELYFGSSTFEIRKGDILAREDSRIIYIDDTELEKPISSIFNVNKVPNQEEDIIPEFSDEKIDINLREELFNIYYKFKDFNNGALRRYVTGIVVYPVLVEAVTRICDFYQYNLDDGSDDKRWFRAIEHKAEKIGIPLVNYMDSPATLADRLLGNISFDALRSLKDTLESEMNSGEVQIIGGVD